MKNAITLVVCVLILLTLMLQYNQDQINILSRYNVEKYVNTALIGIRHDGYISENRKTEMQEAIAKILGVEPEEIIVEGTATIKYRQNIYSETQMIHYKITAPVKRIILSAKFYGIPEEDNKGTIRIEGYVMSERLTP